MKTQEVIYKDGDDACHAYMAFDEARQGKQPTVIIVHAFDGLTDFIRDYAQKVVDAGYVAFCVDMFGEGKTSDNFDGCMSLIMPFFNERQLLLNRIHAGFEACKSQEIVDADKIGAMGFCFGGLTVLDLARSGANVKGVVGMHSALMALPEEIEQGEFRSKVLILNGYDDPQVGPEQLAVFAEELNQRNVDWQYVFFSKTQHAYTEPHASDIGGPESGRVYSPDSARRAWDYTRQFFDEVL